MPAPIGNTHSNEIKKKALFIGFVLLAAFVSSVWDLVSARAESARSSHLKSELKAKHKHREKWKMTSLQLWGTRPKLGLNEFMFSNTEIFIFFIIFIIIF